MTETPDGGIDRFAAVHAERGYTIGVYLPPQAPWETVDATLDVIASHVYSLPGDGWDGFVVGLAGDQLGIDTALPDGTHVYMSTSCLHGLHDHCSAMVGTTGEKRPGVCKWCDAVCRCPVCKHDEPTTVARPEAEPVAACRTWTVTTTVTAPTPADAEHWAGTLRDLQLAEHGQHMDLQIEVAPVVAETPLVARMHRQVEQTAAMLVGADAPASVTGAAAGEEQQRLCPTVCEADCPDACHEGHRPVGQRDHKPDDCLGYRRSRHWPSWNWAPFWKFRPVPSIEETVQQVIDDLAERGIRLVVPGYDTPPEPGWPFGVQRGDWVTLFGELSGRIPDNAVASMDAADNVGVER